MTRPAQPRHLIQLPFPRHPPPPHRLRVHAARHQVVVRQRHPVAGAQFARVGARLRPDGRRGGAGRGVGGEHGGEEGGERGGVGGGGVDVEEVVGGEGVEDRDGEGREEGVEGGGREGVGGVFGEEGGVGLGGGVGEGAEVGGEGGEDFEGEVLERGARRLVVFGASGGGW